MSIFNALNSLLGTKVAVNSGNKDAGTIRAVLATDQPTLTNLIGRVSASNEVSTIYNGTTALTPKFAKIDTAASADLIALVSSKKLTIVAGFLSVAGDTTIKFQSGGSTDLTGAMTVKAGGGFVWPYNPVGYFQTASGAKLNMVLGTGVQVSGGLTYLEV